MRVVVVGAGSWGTALALILGRNGHDVCLVAHTEEAAAEIGESRENLQYLPGFRLPESVSVVGQRSGTAEGDFGVIAVPTGVVRDVLGEFEGVGTVCVASKGLDPRSGQVLSEVVEGALPGKAVAALSGPNLAVELARGIPTAAVVACPDQAAGELVRAGFMGPTYRVYVSDDRKGVEVAGALKNVIAIGAGISDGMGFGDNTKGAFVARGLGEMVRLGMAMGAKMETFLGLAGVGDLFATASSTLSRNYRVGRALGEGTSLSEAVDSLGQVAEGVPTCEVAVKVAQSLGVKVPLMDTLYAVIHGQIRANEAVGRLMERNTLRETGE